MDGQPGPYYHFKPILSILKLAIDARISFLLAPFLSDNYFPIYHVVLEHRNIIRPSSMTLISNVAEFCMPLTGAGKNFRHLPEKQNLSASYIFYCHVHLDEFP